MFLNRFKMIFHERKAENMAVRIKDIARKANVSEATVSLALNNNPLVNEETAKTIKRIAREMGYTPNPYARRLVLKKSNTLGVVVPDIENVFYASFVHYLNLCCRETNYSLSIFISGNRPEREEKIAEDLIAMQAEGVIYIPVNVPNKNMDQVQKLQAAGIPVICATTAFGTLPSVMCDLENGMFLLVSHMLQKGYRKIAYISGPRNVYALDLRERGLRSALQSFQIESGKVPLFFMEAVTYQCACNAAEQILEKYRGKINGIICVNDIMALGVINTLKQHNIQIPEEIAVAGFDDSIFSVTSPVPITTVRQNVSEIAEKSLQKLLSLIDTGEAQQTLLKEIIPVELITRASTE